MFRELFRQVDEDGITPVYFRTVLEHERVFRGVVSDVKQRSGLAHSINTEAPIAELLAQCYPAQFYGRFTVADFLVGPREGAFIMEEVGKIALNEAVIAYQNIATMSGGGAIIKYEIADDETVAINSVLMRMCS